MPKSSLNPVPYAIFICIQKSFQNVTQQSFLHVYLQLPAVSSSPVLLAKSHKSVFKFLVVLPITFHLNSGAYILRYLILTSQPSWQVNGFHLVQHNHPKFSAITPTQTHRWILYNSHDFTLKFVNMCFNCT